MSAPVIGNGLTYTAGVIYSEHGEEGLAAWEAKLTPEQRLAMNAEWDQFCSGLRELSAAGSRAAVGLKAQFETLSALLSAYTEANEGENDAP